MDSGGERAERRGKAPKLCLVDLSAWREPGLAPAGARTWIAAGDLSPASRALAELGGSALALAVMAERHPEGFAIAVGRAVQQGQATAARASLLVRSPMTGRLSQGQVGSDFARRLARLGAGLLIVGRAPWRDAVLWIDGAGELRLEQVPGLEAIDSLGRAQPLHDRWGAGAVLRPGPAAHAGTRFANLCAGSEPASFVGRGGMGYAFAQRGLAALMITAEPVPDREELDGWVELLLRSPRLVARALGQRLQEAEGMPPTQSQGAQRHGCQGCPTPCGFVLEQGNQRMHNARFSALEPVMRWITGGEWEATAELLRECNRLGVDALEASSALHWVLAQTHPAPDDPKSRLESSLERLRGLCLGLEEPLSFQRGAKALYGAEPGRFLAQGEAVRPAQDWITRLAQHVGVRGAEPMRSFPFFVGDRSNPELMQRLVAPMELPPQTSDRSSPVGKGRLLWWHENFVAAVDALGICAFSVAGVLSDGLVEFEELAQRILPEGFELDGAQGRAATLLLAGAQILDLFQALDGSATPSDGVGDDAAARLALAEYRTLRAGRGLVPPAFLRGDRELPALEIAPPVQLPVREGAYRIHVRASGALARRLPALWSVSFERAPAWSDVLRALADEHPAAAAWLLVEGRPIPAALVGDEVLSPGSILQDGTEVALFLAISGG
ncbi:MAG: hypothetical protein H6829_00105 [Planctomycetes bacterium]|nr:hypothetical protein [Planctomycetota bacterium]HPF14723.1 aldehyde ferredoxin oxidoreductase N-terminal domain-containing protein [Planctomycetota bacterium]